MIDVITDTSATPTFKVYIDCWAYTGEVTIIDFSWYAPYKETGDTIICIFAYCMFLWNIFIKLPDIIHGAGASSYVGNMVGDIQAYKATGFGRSSSYKNRGF